MLINPKLNEVLQAIVAAGGQPRLVGGIVRDQVLGIVPKDFDIEVSLMQPNELKEVLSKFGTVDPVGKQFAVFKLHHLSADFSLPRLENKIGVGHKDFDVIPNPNLSLEERCRRRDLTMNAMELNPFTLEISDPFNGQADMKAGRMRATDPKTFVEDDLRALRVMQFVSRFPDMVPDEELIELCSKADLSHLPGDRLCGEFQKMFLKGSRPDLGLEFLKKANLLRFFPELQALDGCPQHPVYHSEGDVMVHSVMATKVAAGLRSGVEEDDLALMFGILCHDMGKPPTTTWCPIKKRIVSNGHDEAGVAPAEAFLKRLNAPLWLVKSVTTLVREHLRPFMLIKESAGPTAYRRLARRMDGVSLNLLAKVAISDSEGRVCFDSKHQTREDINTFLKKAEEAGVQNLSAAPEDIVKGRDLLALGHTPGRMIGVILQRCREVQDETGLTSPDLILEIVLPEFNAKTK